MKEIRSCVICHFGKFTAKTTSVRKTCSHICSKEYLKKYNAEYSKKPEVIKRRKMLDTTPQYKARRKIYYKKRRQTPGVIEYINEYNKKHYRKPHILAKKKAYRIQKKKERDALIKNISKKRTVNRSYISSKNELVVTDEDKLNFIDIQSNAQGPKDIT